MGCGAEPGCTVGEVVIGGGGGGGVVGGGFTPPCARAALEKLNANSNSPNFLVVFIMNVLFAMVVKVAIFIDRPTCRVNYVLFSPVFVGNKTPGCLTSRGF
jgi:hypothetical protein